MMKYFLPFLYFVCFMQAGLSAQQLPAGYILQYGQNFSAGKSMEDFWFSRQSLWEISKEKNNSFLHLSPINHTDSILPGNRCILKNSIYGDFILEADIMPLGGTKNVCFLLGLKDSTRYYMLILSANPSDSTQGIYVVKNSLRRKLPAMVSGGNFLVAGSWQKFRVERNITSRTIRIFKQDQARPAMEVKDYELVMGMIGFGTIGSPIAIDNLSIWAPTVIPEDELDPVP
jgi:hypothetical protein